MESSIKVNINTLNNRVKLNLGMKIEKVRLCWQKLATINRYVNRSRVYNGSLMIFMPENISFYRRKGWFGALFTLSPGRSSPSLFIRVNFVGIFSPPLKMSSLPSHSKLFAGKVGVGT